MLRGGRGRVRDAVKGKSLALLQGQMQASDTDLRSAEAPQAVLTFLRLQYSLTLDAQQHLRGEILKMQKAAPQLGDPDTKGGTGQSNWLHSLGGPRADV